MESLKKPMLLRLYTDEGARHGDQSLVDLVVHRAQREGLAGATALRGRIGFGGRRGSMHEHHAFGIDDNMPMVIEIVDEEARLRAFLPKLSDLRNIGLATLERVELVSIPVGS